MGHGDGDSANEGSVPNDEFKIKRFLCIGPNRPPNYLEVEEIFIFPGDQISD